jgi:hypothetical protein
VIDERTLYPGRPLLRKHKNEQLIRKYREAQSILICVPLTQAGGQVDYQVDAHNPPLLTSRHFDPR